MKAHTEAMQRHLDVAPLNWNVTVLGSVVDPLEVVGADILSYLENLIGNDRSVRR